MNAEKIRILIVDDEAQLRRLLRLSLESNGYTVIEAESGNEALRQVKDYLPNLVILDLGLPDISGRQVLKAIREWSETPVIILSVQDDDEDKIEALDEGANDYVTKPFSVNELLARIRVGLRPREKEAEPEGKIHRFGSVEIDLGAHIVKRNGAEVRLTSTEYTLLQFFVSNAGRILTHKQILKEIWGPNHEEEIHYLRVYVGSLRKKIETDAQTPKLILTEPGIGYRLKVPG